MVPQPRSDSSALPPTKLYAGSYIHATASAQHRLPSSSKQAGRRSTAGAHVLHGAAAASSSAKFNHREENPFCARSARVPMLSLSESRARVALQVSTRESRCCTNVMMIKAFGTYGSEAQQAELGRGQRGVERAAAAAAAAAAADELVEN